MQKQALGIGYTLRSTPAATAAIPRNRKREARPEVRLRSTLHRRGLRFRVQRQVARGSITVRPDVRSGPAMAALSVKGVSGMAPGTMGNHRRKNNRWYSKPKLQWNRRRDQILDEALHLANRSVAWIWVHEGPSEALAQIRTALGRNS